MALGDGLPSPNPIQDIGTILGLNNPTFPAIEDTKTPYVEATFQRKIEPILGERWNQQQQYFFMVATARPDGSVQAFPAKNDLLFFNKTVVYFDIPPSSISLSNPFAINVSATNGGILEEHNGLVFRQIQISGTTGLWADKPNIGTQPKLGTFGKIVTNLFPGATTAIGSAAASVKNTVSSITGGGKNKIPVPLTATGYYKFWVLHNFILAYVEAKKFSINKDMRLIFGMAKDNLGLVCTPVLFDLKRDVGSGPLLYRYNIVLKAWDVTTANAPQVSVLSDVPTPDNVNAIKAITNTLIDARAVITSATNVLSAVNSDLASIMNVYTQGVLVAKSAAGLAQAVEDFPQVFSTNAAVLLAGANNQLLASVAAIQPTSETNSGSNINYSSVDETQSQNVSAANMAAITAAGGTVTTPTTTPGGEDIPVQNSRSTQAQGALTTQLSNPSFTSTSINTLSIPPSVQSQINDQVTTAMQTTSDQITQLSNDLQTVSDNYMANLGAMDPVYAETYSLPPPVPTTNAPTEDDILNQVALQESKTSFLSFLATGQIFAERDPDPFVSANQALDPTDQMTSPNSAIPVPFQRGATLEILAQQYLGDPNRAREIAILNNLRPPFIDEIGYTMPITNANGNMFVITLTQGGSFIVIGQPVALSGTDVITTQRTVLNITDIGNSQQLVVVDGADNLSIYAPSSDPTLFARLPGTVGYGDTVLIPSATVPNAPLANRPTALLQQLTPAQKVFNVDIALDSTGRDFAVDSSGDIVYATGYTNAVQAIRLAIETEKGELEQHPDYGLPVAIGLRDSDLSTNDLTALVQERIAADPRFTGVIANTQISGSTVSIQITATGAQGAGEIPVSFDVGVA